MDPQRGDVSKNTGFSTLTLWYDEHTTSSIYQHTTWMGALINVSKKISSNKTRLLNGMFSSGFPSVNTAIKNLQNCDQDGIMGGSPHMKRPGQHKKWKARYRYDKPQKCGKALEYYCSYGRNQLWPLVIICNNNFFN